MSGFKNGDIVELKAGQYPESIYNPLNTKGVVDTRSIMISVDWENSESNNYSEEDLKLSIVAVKLVRRKSKKRIINVSKSKWF